MYAVTSKAYHFYKMFSIILFLGKKIDFFFQVLKIAIAICAKHNSIV